MIIFRLVHSDENIGNLRIVNVMGSFILAGMIRQRYPVKWHGLKLAKKIQYLSSAEKFHENSSAILVDVILSAKTHSTYLIAAQALN